MIDPPFSTRKLAERWDCNAQTIRNLVEAGDLEYFKIGQKLIRIPAAAVERFECQNLQQAHTENLGPSKSIAENMSSSGKDQIESPQHESRLVRMTEGLPKLALVKSGTPTTDRSAD